MLRSALIPMVVALSVASILEVTAQESTELGGLIRLVKSSEIMHLV